MSNNRVYLDILPNDVVSIPNSYNWIDRFGNVYGIETRIGRRGKPYQYYGKLFKLIPHENQGYLKCFINYKNENHSKGMYIHRLVATIFLENPNNYSCVGHMNNIKTDNRVENLYWTTHIENTKKAWQDGLFPNKKCGYEHFQSHPVVMYNTYTNEELNRYGSLAEASRKTGIPIETIRDQAKDKTDTVKKSFYFRFQNDNSIEPPKIIIQYDFKTDVEIDRYINMYEASEKTGLNRMFIYRQCKLNIKPNRSKYGTYFLYSR